MLALIGGDNVSRIFKISGNFVQYGEWAKPDPAFSGKIVVDDNDEFCGYCDELYGSSMSEENRIRYLAGAFAKNGRNEERGIAFYKMSNDKRQAPLMYVTPDLTDPESGSWAALFASLGAFAQQGRSRVTVEEEEYSEEEEKSIKEKYETLDKSVTYNGELLEQISCCKDIIIHAF